MRRVLIELRSDEVAVLRLPVYVANALIFCFTVFRSFAVTDILRDRRFDSYKNMRCEKFY